MRNRLLGALAVVLLAGFLVVLMRIATLPLESGDAYPPYSTLRADPRGAMALYESLAGLAPDLRIGRNFEPLSKLKAPQATVFLLGVPAWRAAAWSDEELKFYESLANDGARLVVAFLPEPPQTASRKRALRPDYRPPVQKRWHVSVDAYEGSETEAEEAGVMPRETYAYFDPEEDSGWETILENDQDDPILITRTFGKGQILMLTDSYPLSNEGLRAERDVELISALNGASKQIVFDESHLGVENTGSVGTLIRRYRLTGAFAVALLLGLLFLWKNSTSLLPQPPEPETSVAAGADARSGLINLLKRSVPSKQLAQACWDRWFDTRALGRPIAETRVQRARAELTAASTESPAAVYRKIQHILTEKL